ncbi:PD-(D/E)XK nuclease family protein [Bradyrhizobium sp. ORS 285]|uniref:PD-(D/E)XK nuclease family protein n=1 Tax=Bradyrhizobium sp. ORS 285 TaxID=115808 RepID=UPI00054F649F|nr:PD-(D/E)XK nuclease family protein [Bradyrhizobium sp. ORS 285]
MTECLADLFNRLPLGSQIDLSNSLFVPKLAQNRFTELASEHGALRLETQHPIEGGRIDLVLYVGDDPTIAIESKISAPLPEDQLARYGRWIRDEAAGSLAIVCFLTHTTPPPPGFRDGGPVSGKAMPHVVNWADVARRFSQLGNDDKLDPSLRLIVNEFRRFLEENNMSTEYAGRDEFAAALVYLRAGSLMDRTFSEIYSHVKALDGHFRKNESITEYSLKFNSELKLIWGWAYLAHPTLGALFFGYGIALDPSSTFKGGNIPTTDSVFICLGAEDRRSIQSVRAVKDVPQKPWTWADIDDWFAIISFKPLHEFLKVPTEFSSKMKAWIDEEKDDINHFVDGLTL